MLSAISNLAVIAFVVMSLAGLFFGIKGDLSFHSAGFMNEKISMSSEASLRDVASQEGEKVSILYFPLSDENYARISGDWLIYNYINRHDQDEKVNSKVSLELVGNSKVIIDGDSGLEFRISYLSNKDRIALVRKVEGGYEILEAEKIKEKAVVAENSKEESKAAGPKGINMIEGELILEKATNPIKSQKIYAGELVRGSMNIADNAINNFEATIYEENGSFNTIEFSFAQVNDGGQFEVEVSGITSQAIFTNNGKDAFRIRFATGPHAGLLLNFISEDKWYESREAEFEKEKESDEKEPSENRLVVSKLNVEQADVVNQRSDRAFIESQDISETTQEDISPEEMAERLKGSSFNFSESSAQENEG
jgi:hypothetical protein